MANLAVSLVIHLTDVERGWMRYPAVRGANGRIRPGYAMVGKEVIRFERFSYQLRTYEGKKTKYEPLGTDALKAAAALEQKESTLEATSAWLSC
jgi:hypothetical protein